MERFFSNFVLALIVFAGFHVAHFIFLMSLGMAPSVVQMKAAYALGQHVGIGVDFVLMALVFVALKWVFKKAFC